MATTRLPAVAGAFYPAQPERLRTMIASLGPVAAAAAPALGVMLPHAGYVYSGRAAALTLARVHVPARVLLLGPNHTGRGEALAAAADDEWLTPLGKVAVDRELLAAIAEADSNVRFDGRAHASEHSLEVEVPLLQAARPDVRIAPIVVGTLQLPVLQRLGRAIADVIGGLAEDERPLILISSDMTHYEPAETARVKDAKALARLAALDPEGLHRTVTGEGITMCGIAPAVAALEALRALGARHVEQVVYTHSGVVTGDDREVVAYAGMVFTA